MNTVLETLSHLDGPQLAGVITQGFIFLGVAVTAIGTYLVSRQNTAAAKKMQEIKVEINGRIAQLLQAHGEASETKGFMAGKLAERADPQVAVSTILDLAIGAKGPIAIEGPTGPSPSA